ncbi:MAG: 3,4-dihydroxy-2-butanone-4-phosphate synthase [Myxococcaceae bacterium]|nr:3,4-dihydroxy-2-butanone-4-phosphate synthase [Myxococcaceae bacterium]MBH2006301.1 3,4-dihydroxy-2-butanone-4-phosphate synthase [Myxococcaceae bacterium]
MDSIDSALDALRAGKLILLVDDQDRENEGDLVMAAEKATPESVNFMIQHGSGIVCVTLSIEQAKRLELPLMVPKKSSHSHFVAAFTHSIEAAHGVTTGVSAADRAQTIRIAANPNSRPADLSRPGHVFPLIARAKGVLERPGHTEGSVDLMKLAGLAPSGVLCELINPDGTMSRMPEMKEFAKKHNLVILSIQQLIEYRKANE